jgi:hypothetical protein
MAEVHAALADADAYTVRSRAEQLLIGLGFKPEQLEESGRQFFRWLAYASESGAGTDVQI